jgi:hypothetical protein
VRVAASQLTVAVAAEAPRDAALRERERVSAAARYLQQERTAWCIAWRFAWRIAWRFAWRFACHRRQGRA